MSNKRIEHRKLVAEHRVDIVNMSANPLFPGSGSGDDDPWSHFYEVRSKCLLCTFFVSSPVLLMTIDGDGWPLLLVSVVLGESSASSSSSSTPVFTAYVTARQHFLDELACCKWTSVFNSSSIAEQAGPGSSTIYPQKRGYVQHAVVAAETSNPGVHLQ